MIRKIFSTIKLGINNTYKLFTNYDNYPSIPNFVNKGINYLSDHSYIGMSVLNKLYNIPTIIMSILNNNKLLIVMIISSYFIYMMSEFNLLYSNYMNTLDSFGRHNLPQMIREITQLQQMYTILPEHDVALTDQSIYRVYSTHGIIDYKYFLYHHNSMGELHNMMEDNPLLASEISNAIKQNIINNHQESNLLITDIFVKHAITLAAPFLGGVLALIAIYTIENIVLLSQGVLA